MVRHSRRCCAIRCESERLLAEARTLRAEQLDLLARGVAAIIPAAVVQRLVGATRKSSPARSAGRIAEHVVPASDGAMVAKGQRASRQGEVTITIPTPAKQDRTALLSALAEILDRLSQAGRSGRADGR